MSLKKQTFSGLIWMFVDTFLLKGLTFVTVIVLARILGPKDFGLIGMISVFIAVGNSLIDSGLSSSIIRTENINNSDLSTIFYLNLAISFLVFFSVFFAAPLIADFFQQDILKNIIRLYCLSFIFSAFSSVQLAILNKEMEFRKMMQYNIPGVLLGIIVGIALGYLGFGAWSIVIMYLTTQFVQSIILWRYTIWKPTKTFSIEKMKFHYNFGYKLLLSGLLDTIFKNIYNFLIGKFFSVQTLGFYERATAFNEYPVNIITGLINKVSYPLLSKIQNDKEKISFVYKQMLQFTFFVTTPLMLGAAAIAKPLIYVVLGEQWLPAVPLFQIICLASIFYPIHSYNISVLKVYGRSDLFLKLEILKKVIITISILVSFQFGVLGLVWSSVVTSFIALLINTHYSSEIINYTTKQQLCDMLPVLITSGIVYLTMELLVIQLETRSNYLQIILSTLIGFSLYLLVHYAIRSSNLKFAVNLIKQIKK
jgi:O-antigen/teichoic acid export membrane protein